MNAKQMLARLEALESIAAERDEMMAVHAEREAMLTADIEEMTARYAALEERFNAHTTVVSESGQTAAELTIEFLQAQLQDKSAKIESLYRQIRSLEAELDELDQPSPVTTEQAGPEAYDVQEQIYVETDLVNKALEQWRKGNSAAATAVLEVSLESTEGGVVYNSDEAGRGFSSTQRKPRQNKASEPRPESAVKFSRKDLQHILKGINAQLPKEKRINRNSKTWQLEAFYLTHQHLAVTL